ncbi:MAG: hypothetical protein ACUVQQ_06660, partial [Thermogutta sp.]
AAKPCGDATTSLRWWLPQSVLHHARTRSLGRQLRGGKERWASSAWDRSKKRSSNELGPETWRTVSLTRSLTRQPRWRSAPIGPFSTLWAYFSPFFWEFLAAFS